MGLRELTAQVVVRERTGTRVTETTASRAAALGFRHGHHDSTRRRRASRLAMLLLSDESIAGCPPRRPPRQAISWRAAGRQDPAGQVRGRDHRLTAHPSQCYEGLDESKALYSGTTEAAPAHPGGQVSGRPRPRADEAPGARGRHSKRHLLRDFLSPAALEAISADEPSSSRRRGRRVELETEALLLECSRSTGRSRARTVRATRLPMCSSRRTTRGSF